MHTLIHKRFIPLLFYDNLKSRLRQFIHTRNQKNKCPSMVGFTALDVLINYILKYLVKERLAGSVN